MKALNTIHLRLNTSCHFLPVTSFCGNLLHDVIETDHFSLSDISLNLVIWKANKKLNKHAKPHISVLLQLRKTHT
jgi:hypothetical protein